VRFIFDACISFRFVDMLAALDRDVEHVSRVFDESISDVEFLSALKGKHDVYITYDHRQKTRQAEAAAIRESGVTALWLGPHWGKKSFWGQAKWLITRWETIEQYARSTVPGTCAEVKENGKSMPFTL